VNELCQLLTGLLTEATSSPRLIPPTQSHDVTQLIIVDEADRLSVPSLEQLRDIYDGQGIGLVLIGMPGIEKRLARYGQFYSRVGFVHRFRPLGGNELRGIIGQRWEALGCCLDEATDAEAIAAITRITAGNFRLIERLFSQIARVLEINRLHTITKEVVESARENLVIGTA
jgi:DNA transposition AAA+ family ATPase